jgi:3-dehydroquinate synthase II
MEIWIDAEKYGNHSHISGHKVWEGQDPEVASVALDDFRGQEEAISLIGMVPWVMLRCSDWKMIPLENIVAAASNSGTKIAVSISEEIDVQGVAFALEHGVDAIVIPPEEMAPSLWLSAKIVAKEKISAKSEDNVSDISVATVSSVTTAGMGERVCVDLTERLSDGEGIFVGSSSSWRDSSITIRTF